MNLMNTSLRGALILLASAAFCAASQQDWVKANAVFHRAEPLQEAQAVSVTGAGEQPEAPAVNTEAQRNPEAQASQPQKDSTRPDRGNKLVRGLKQIGTSVGVIGAIGAFIGLLVGIFTSATILGAVVNGALVGAGVGLVFGLFAALSIWSE